MAMQRGLAARAASLARASGVALAASWGWMPAVAKIAGGPGRWCAFGDFERAVHLVGAVADADGEDGVDSGGVGAGEDAGEFVGGVHVEMGVGVDEVHGCR